MASPPKNNPSDAEKFSLSRAAARREVFFARELAYTLFKNNRLHDDLAF